MGGGVGWKLLTSSSSTEILNLPCWGLENVLECFPFSLSSAGVGSNSRAGGVTLYVGVVTSYAGVCRTGTYF